MRDEPELDEDDQRRQPIHGVKLATSPRPWPTWRRSESCTSVCRCTGGTAGFAHGVVSSHELGSTAIAARACFAKGAISHFHYGAPGCSDIVES